MASACLFRFLDTWPVIKINDNDILFFREVIIWFSND